MKAFFLDIFEYHHHFNQKLVQQLSEHASVLPDRTIPLFSHSINAQQIWNARITNRPKLGVHQVHSLEVCKEIDNENYAETLHILNVHEIDEVIGYHTSKGVEFQNSIQEIFFHISNHFSHHRGQIISDIRQSGIAPVITDYIFYKR